MTDAEKPARPAHAGPAGVDPALLEMLVCPLTRQPLQYDAQRQELVSPAAGLAFPIRDGIPVMLPDEARVLEKK
ncbi:MAG: Trm112 family protein [Pseudomonadota bacterium]|nr:Trm112 family protein [Pseudomonadota bacterium]